jgi:hypothetical protein
MLKKVKVMASTVASSSVALFTNKASAAAIGTGDLAQGTLETYITAALSFAIWAAGLLSVAFIIIGGFQYITAGASKDGATKAKTTLTYAIVGLVIVLLALLIRNFVLGRLSVTAPTL